MNKIVLISAFFTSALSFSALAATQVSKHEIDQFKLVKIGDIEVSQSEGAISSPSDLNGVLSAKADEKGGKYYYIVAAREHGPNFEAVAEVYKDADK